MNLNTLIDNLRDIKVLDACINDLEHPDNKGEDLAITLTLSTEFNFIVFDDRTIKGIALVLKRLLQRQLAAVNNEAVTI